MRYLALVLAFVATLTGCDWCLKDPSLCMPPTTPTEDSEDTPPAPPTEAPAPDAGMPDSAMQPDAAMPDSVPPAPPERQPSDASTSPTWHRNGSAFAEWTAMVSILIVCVDSDGEFVFSGDTRDYGWDELTGLERIDVGEIPYGQHPTAELCYGLLSQNEQGTPDTEVPSPGDFSYPIHGVIYDAPVVEDGDFEGWWEMDLYPDPPAVN